MWTLIVIIICTIIGAAFRKYTKEEKQEAKVDCSTPLPDDVKNYTAEGVLKGLNAEVHKEEKEGNYQVKFQGGNFLFHFNSEAGYADIIYPGFSNFSSANLYKALLNSNKVNYRYAVWACYVEKANQESNEDEFMTSLSTRYYLAGTLSQAQEGLKDTLEFAFHIARDFRESLAKNIKEATESENILLENNELQTKIAHVIRLHELNHLEERKEEYPKDSTFTADNLLKLYDNADFGCLQELRIIHEEQVKKLTDINEITAFNLREYIHNHPNATSIRNLTLVFGFEHQDLFVNLTKAKGSTENSLFFVVNVVRSGSELDTWMDNRSPVSSRTMLEVRLADSEKDYWEAKYMLDDAKDKQQNGRSSELTDEQRIMLSHIEPSIQMDLYWGKKFYNNGCCFQALFYFNRTLYHLGENAAKWDDKQRELYYEVSYYIGFIYMDLNMKDRAFYYLYAPQQRGSINATKEFANCLCNMNDPSAKDYIISTRNQVIELMNKDEEEAERLSDFYRFLTRRLAYAMIERKEYDEAETLLNQMIERGEDAEFAKDELDYIKRQRGKECK